MHKSDGQKPAAQFETHQSSSTTVEMAWQPPGDGDGIGVGGTGVGVGDGVGTGVGDGPGTRLGNP